MVVLWLAALRALGVLGYIPWDVADLRLNIFVMGTKIPASGCDVVK